MKKRGVLIFVSLLILVLTISLVSAERLPTIGGDSGTWGTVLNNYLFYALGANATTLNITGAAIFGSNVTIDGNLSLGQKIVFSLGEMIDNIVDGWVTITGSLNVTKNLNVDNITANYFIGNGSQLTGIEATSIGDNSITSTKIVDATIVDADISDTTNLTLGEKITFTLGEMIDNIIDGWITITGSLNVTKNLNVAGNVTGDWATFNNLNVTNISLNGETISDWSETQNSNGTFNPIKGYTSSSYDGNISNGSLNGYVAANAICKGQYSGSHFCLKSEVLKSIANGNYSFSGTAWFQNGPPGFTASADDCSGWTTNTNTYLGPFWNWDANDYAGRGALTNCANTKQLMCCGGSS